MDNPDWKYAEEFAEFLYDEREDRRAVTEVGKLMAFLRRRSGMGEDAGKELDLYLERMTRSGHLVARSQQTVGYFKKLKEAREKCLKGINDAGRLQWIIGWGRRLVLAYQEVPPHKILPVKHVSIKRTDEQVMAGSAFAVLGKAMGVGGADDATSGESGSESVAVKALNLKRGLKLVAETTRIDGKRCIAKLENGTEVRFDKPGYGAISEGTRVKIELISKQQGFWKAKCRSIQN